jgi:hypothetical protein
MRHRLTVVILALLMVWVLSSTTARAQSDDVLVHGTINVALGNKNGIVVLTDSMLTDGGGHQLAQPGQKLFKLDDRTVCSIAGFASATAPIPDLNASTSAIIREYVRESAPQVGQSIAERLRALAFLFDMQLSAISNVRDAGGYTTSINAYAFQLIIAGYDIDDKPKIGRITLRITKDQDSLVPVIESGEVVEVKEKLIWRLNGMPEIAARILQHPDTSIRDEVIQQYAAGLRADDGSSLTVDQMVELAKRLAFYTGKAYPEVGGPNQFAVLQPSHAMRIEQQIFPEPAKPLIRFSLMVASKFRGTNSFRTAPGVPVIFVRCSFADMQRKIDGDFFIGSTFTDSVLAYDGGTVNLGDTNKVINSALLIGALVRPDTEVLRRLSRAFPWARVVRDLPGYPPEFGSNSE